MSNGRLNLTSKQWRLTSLYLSYLERTLKHLAGTFAEVTKAASVSDYRVGEAIEQLNLEGERLLTLREKLHRGQELAEDDGDGIFLELLLDDEDRNTLRVPDEDEREIDRDLGFYSEDGERFL